MDRPRPHRGQGAGSLETKFLQHSYNLSPKCSTKSHYIWQYDSAGPGHEYAWSAPSHSRGGASMAQSFFHTRSSNVATVRVRSTKFGEIIDRNQNARPRPCRVSALRGSWRYALNDLLTSRSDQNIGRRVVSLSGGTGTVVGSISRVNRINTQCVQILLQCVLPCLLVSTLWPD